MVADIPTTPATDALVDLQKDTLAIADGGPAQVAGEHVSGAEWFTAQRIVTAMARLGAQPEDLDRLPAPAVYALRDERRRREEAPRGGGGSQLRAMPATAAHAAASLLLTGPVLHAPDQATAIEILAPWLHHMTAQRRPAGEGALRHLRGSAVLDRVMAEAAPRTSRVAGAIPSHRAAVLEARHVPHLVDLADYAELLRPLLPGTAEVSGRRFGSLALARLAGAGSWAEASTDLGMDPLRAKRVANTLVQRIGSPDTLWAAIQVMADRMRDRGLIDYAARRNAMAELREIPHRDLFRILRPLDRDVTWQRQRHAAAWVWQQFTSGDAREAPAYLHGWEDGTSTESIREGWRRFHTRLPAPGAEALTAWGAARLVQEGIQ
ncbi:hypothetical protein [Streptomyces sp. NPDC051561]|uniref:hypothetical protein n=1 Tax=Streptomyces sp. NPDC051561 TaxID=3365658 RepID=UPI0037AA0789